MSARPAAGAAGGGPSGNRRRWWAPAAAGLVAALLLVAAGVALLVRDGQDGSGDAGDATACPATGADRRPLPGFGEIAIRLTAATGEVRDGCALLADDESSRSQGLMDQQDLRGYDGMLFRFPDPSTTRFFMRNTLIPLSIAFFAEDGSFVSTADMTPCPPAAETCPLYSATAPYRFALEVPAGDLGRLGVGPGSVLAFPTAAG